MSMHRGDAVDARDKQVLWQEHGVFVDHATATLTPAR
jgi:hypothetical protein